MKPSQDERVISRRLFQQFAEVLVDEFGTEKLALILAGADLSTASLEVEETDPWDGVRMAECYARLQQAIRSYYGRGARGILLRIGRGLWRIMLSQSNLLEKAEQQSMRSIPVPARRRRVLETIAGRLQEGGGLVSVHRLDIDLLLVDHSSASTCGQKETSPICIVTIGLIQGGLQWAIGQEAEVEECACRAAGAPACEFKIRLGGAGK